MDLATVVRVISRHQQAAGSYVITHTEHATLQQLGVVREALSKRVAPGLGLGQWKPYGTDDGSARPVTTQVAVPPIVFRL